MPEFLNLPLDLIEVGADRARPLDPSTVGVLAGSIREQGLLQPIVVRRIGSGAYRLIAGNHRLAAFRLLGRETIPAMLSEADSDDAARLAEVMENLGRNELIALDRCHHLFELKQVWERMYPETKHGGDRSKIHTVDFAGNDPEIFGFARANAEKIGLSRSAISKAVRIWTGLAPPIRTRLRGTNLATKQTELKALSELKPDRQEKVLNLILGEKHPEIKNIAAALAFLGSGLELTSLEKQFRAADTAIKKLGDDALTMVVSSNAERLISALQKLGRI